MGIFELKTGELVHLSETNGFFIGQPLTWMFTDGRDEDVLYTDFSSGSVIRMDLDTLARVSIGPAKSDGKPLGIDFDSSTGKIYVAEWGSGRVIEYDINDSTH